VVLGKARAKQDLRNDKEHKRTMPVLLHGDAAFCGQVTGIKEGMFTFLAKLSSGRVLFMKLLTSAGGQTSQWAAPCT